MRYCIRCVQPDTRPGIFFSNEGVCGACLWEDEKKKIDWTAREGELQSIAEKARETANGPYHCAVGVSGGKDSTFQALYAREKLGLRPLLVNGAPYDISELGCRGIENLSALGFDIVTLRPNPQVRRKIMRKDFFSYLNPVKGTEYPLWASAYIIAAKFNIPLVIQGENPGQTLGVSNFTGVGGDALSILQHNTIASDPLQIYADEDISPADLFMYRFDTQEVFDRGIKAIWLSYYAKEWSQPHNAAFAISNGLEIRPNDIDPYLLGTYRRFSQMDSGNLVELNQMLKYIKFGFGQATDHACYDIREGLISRDEAIFLVRELDGKCDDEVIESFCQKFEISIRQFWEHTNSFRGDMWTRTGDGKYCLKDPIWEREPIRGRYGVREIMNRLGM